MNSPRTAQRSWQDELAESLASGRFQKLVLSRPLRQDERIVKVTVRPVTRQDAVSYQWAARTKTQETHRYLTAGQLREEAHSQFAATYGDLYLFTSELELSAKILPNGKLRVQRKSVARVAAPTEHNRSARYLIPPDEPCDFLIAAGVMLPTGQVRPPMYHKFRQINRYLELVQDVLPHLPAEGTLHVADFGCGKSYLTFALHHLLRTIHGRDVDMIGLDLKREVIADCQATADRLGCAGLHFEVGRIAQLRPDTPLDLAVSLHACDTATDDSLIAAVERRASVILAVPCCQHELARLVVSDAQAGLLQYGILRERFASLATDALRANWLELAGYSVQILEFIDLEHTPKNLMLRAVRRTTPLKPDEHQRRLNQYLALKQSVGVTEWSLERDGRHLVPIP